PRWPFDKFPTVDRRIGTSMKSTGEVMAIGRTFEESLLKAVRSLEIDRIGLESNSWSEEELVRELREPTDERLFAIAEAAAPRTDGEVRFLDGVGPVLHREDPTSRANRVGSPRIPDRQVGPRGGKAVRV